MYLIQKILICLLLLNDIFKFNLPYKGTPNRKINNYIS